MLTSMDSQREYLALPKAAAYSGLSRVYLAQLLRTGPIEGFRLGREGFLYTDSLNTFLALERKTGPKTGPKGPRTQGDKLLEQNVRLSLTFRVTVDNETPSTTDEAIEQQQRLLQAVLVDPKTLHTLLLRQVVLTLTTIEWEDWHTLILGEFLGNEEILASVIEKLHPDDRIVFQEALADGSFHERTHAFRERFHVVLDTVSLHQAKAPHNVPKSEP